MGRRFGGRQQARSEPKLPPPSPRPGREQSPARSAHSPCSPPPSPSHAEKPLGSLFSESKSKLGFKLRAGYRGERCTKNGKGGTAGREQTRAPDWRSGCVGGQLDPRRSQRRATAPPTCTRRFGANSQNPACGGRCRSSREWVALGVPEGVRLVAGCKREKQTNR